MKFTRFAGLAVIAAALLLSPLSGLYAQTRPSTNPTYIPNGQLSVQSILQAAVPVSSNSFFLAGDGTLNADITGTFSALTATFQGTTDNTSVSSANANWVNMTVFPVGASGVNALPQTTITASGQYRMFPEGFTRVRLNVSALTGTNVAVQFTGSIGPFVHVAVSNLDLGAVITNASQVAATVNSAQFINLDGSGAYCTFTNTSTSGNPSTTFAIQAYDSASATYQTMVISGALTGPTGAGSIEVYPGIEVSSLPTGISAAQSLKLPRLWRVQEVITGAGTAITGTIGCQVLR